MMRVFAAVVVAAILLIPRAVTAAEPARGLHKDCANCPELVVVPSGSFEMGDAAGRAAEARPAHRVTVVRRFAYSKDKVSFRDWKQCVIAGLCQSLGATGTASLDPIVLVSWVDIQQYLQWLTMETGAEYRLLSEAEWEYIAKSPASATRGFKADGLEWTGDCWHNDYTGAPTDGSSWDADGDCRYHVARGNRPGEVAVPVTTRYRFLFNAMDPALGFRVARTLPE